LFSRRNRRYSLTTLRTLNFPAAFEQLLRRSQLRSHWTTVRAGVGAFTVNRHRRCNDEFFDLRLARQNCFEQNGRAEIVCAHVSLYLVHRLAHADFGRLMKNYVDSFERTIDDLTIAHITLNEFGAWVNVGRRGIFAVHLRHERIENSHTIFALDNGIDQVRADKAGAPGYKHIELFQN